MRHSDLVHVESSGGLISGVSFAVCLHVEARVNLVNVGVGTYDASVTGGWYPDLSSKVRSRTGQFMPCLPCAMRVSRSKTLKR